MKLSGRWIETAGFAAGQRVRINVEHGRLNITANATFWKPEHQ
ncbi:SymE family type I addiction module toxin [Paraburkholderia steynii]